MIELPEIFDEMDNLDVDYYDRCPLKETDATTLEMDGDYAVFVDEKRFETESELKAALMHEVGHCATGATHKVSSLFDVVDKHEAQANKWAFNRFLPFDKLNHAVTSEGKTEPWQLAEYFDLSEEYIRAAVKYYTESLGYKFHKVETESCGQSYRNILNEIALHIYFSKPDITIDNLSEDEAKMILDAMHYPYEEQ